MARRESLSIALGKALDQSGYLRDLREDRSEESEGRIENLMELVSAAREYESREIEPSLAGSSTAFRCCRTSTRSRAAVTHGC